MAWELKREEFAVPFLAPSLEHETSMAAADVCVCVCVGEREREREREREVNNF
jgi:hypothetical protein